MSGKQFQENRLDTVTAHALDSFAQSLSRRSMLARAGKFVISMLGISVVPLLPVDRIVRTAEAQTGGCGAWQLCGIWGRLCNTCACPSGTLQTCPVCTHQGSLWRSCCTVLDSSGNPTPDGRRIIEYIDCCGQQGSPSCNGDASTCDAGQFCRGSEGSQPSWCGGAPGMYHCTRYRVGGNC